MELYGVDRVYNADQTAVFYEYLPKRTIHHNGARSVWIKCGGGDKERTTAMLLGDSFGNEYDLFVVHKQAKSKVPATVHENLQVRNGFCCFVSCGATSSPCKPRIMCRSTETPLPGGTRRFRHIF
ncbi:hypothetical protein ACHHYP_20859 [Achlya hypogyna]|uniref:DDE-1 domain-containing protein n=1 Tax=Achlya hypogyna TaxID=1202772 RepID=A0A1V9Y4V7_ACHHY|nr:hypothetical protein ACHHYP_20859 [Achlya hypogyna]